MDSVQQDERTEYAEAAVGSVGEGFQAGLWRYGPGTADVRQSVSNFVICLCGRCGYEPLAEVASYIRRHWKPEKQQLVVDFTNVGDADPSGVRFLVYQLVEAARRGGIVSLVHAPLEARACIKAIWGRHQVRFVQDLDEALPPSSTDERREPGTCSLRSAGDADTPLSPV